ncbi:hypothetical protein IFM89_020419 [Coptis chinensis]|uniref:Uncharacterized protein n=1 Tax=Coptis chinensis TaxID=261450 RepID=A0A835HP09_9MAGN|nr:hypothetical protein IFM89_020419 [Coptis chinensis]
MDIKITNSNHSVIKTVSEGEFERDQLRVKRKTLQTVLEQCQRALELLSNKDGDEAQEEEVMDDHEGSSSASQCDDSETAELCHLLKSRVESPDFLEKLGSIHLSVSQHNAAEEVSSWDVINENDLWEEGNFGGGTDSDQECYVLVKQEDIVEGIACFTAAYLLSLKETKELSPSQLQEGELGYRKLLTFEGCMIMLFHGFFIILFHVITNYEYSKQPTSILWFIVALSKTFSLKKRKGKLQKAWNGSKFVYNVASWGATAVG